MATLNDSDCSAFRALLARHGRAEAEFQLHEEHLRWAADGTVEGYLWVIHVAGKGRIVYAVSRHSPNWLAAFEGDLQRGAFPAAPNTQAPG
jgi:hypothetical protein